MTCDEQTGVTKNQTDAAKRVEATAIAAGPDGVIAQVENWLSTQHRLHALEEEWCMLEAALLAACGAQDIELHAAEQSDSSAAGELRVLSEQINAMGNQLSRLARRIVDTPTFSAQGALAKIELGLRIQGPYDWQDDAYALVQNGMEQLALYLGEENVVDET